MGPLPAVLPRLLIVAASLATRRGLWGMRTSAAGAREPSSHSSRALESGLNSCGIQARLLPCVWGPPRSGIEPGSPGDWQEASSPLSRQGGPEVGFFM